MALTFKIYADSALTSPQVGDLVATQAADGSTPPLQFQFFFGSLGSAGGDTPDRKLQAESNPGVDQITLLIADTAPGVGHEAVEVKLAATQVLLGTAVAGDPLDIGAVLTSGSANDFEFWVEIDDATGVVATATELSFETNLVRETDV